MNQTVFNELYDREQNYNVGSVLWSAGTSMFGGWWGSAVKTSFGVAGQVMRPMWESKILPNASMFVPKVTGSWMINEVYKRRKTWITY